MKRLTLDVPDELHARLARLAALRRRGAPGCAGETPELVAAALLEDALHERLPLAERLARAKRAAAA